MNKTRIQDILPLIETPSRYLGSEVNRILKHKARCRIVLAFPDLYEIGTSHFGMQILYHIVNARKALAAERVFAPAPDMEEKMRTAGLPLSSLETGTPIKAFDIVGFSLLYELNYTNVLNMLNLAGIPLFESQRDSSYPLVIAGGPCTCNPEPMAPFFDAIVIGDGEQTLPWMCERYLEWKKNGDEDKTTILEEWSKIQGVYIPSFFESRNDSHGFQLLLPRFDHYTHVRRTVISDLDTAPFPDKPVIPFGRPIHDRLRIEIARGCTRGCRFCQAGMIYRPVRERSPASILSILDASLRSTGYEDVSLMSLSSSDYGCIIPVIEQLMYCSEQDHVAVSLPSLRAGTLSPRLMSLIKSVRKTGFTIAPEAGSQRLRDVINKNIVEEDILHTVADAFELGWTVIKLYFMIGLPTETQEDLHAIVHLVDALRKIKAPKGKRGQINVSVTTFIPKPHTPFQWEPQLRLSESREKIEWLKSQLRIPKVKFKWQQPEVSLVEGLMARGDRSVSRVIVNAYEKGCRFDGWTDSFAFDRWQEAIRDTGSDPGFYTTRRRSVDEPLPWDHIRIGVTPSFLKKERQRALEKRLTDDCRTGDCSHCGVCDFKTLKPVTFRDAVFSDPESKKENSSRVFTTLEVTYEKIGPARFFGHLEMAKIFLRAFRRTGVSLKYSEGFHPMPKISFDNPLPLGMESESECFYIAMAEPVLPEALGRRLNEELPDGLRIIDCRRAVRKRRDPVSDTYEIILTHGLFDENALQCFREKDEVILNKKGKKGRVTPIDLKVRIKAIQTVDQRRLRMTITADEGPFLRPAEAVTEIFSLSDEHLKTARVIKKATRKREPIQNNRDQ